MSETKEHNFDPYKVIEYVGKNIFMIENIIDNEICDKIITEMDTMEYEKLFFTNTNNVECYNVKNPTSLSIKNDIIDIFTKIIKTMNNIPFINSNSFSFFQLRKIYGMTREHADGVFGEIITHPIDNALIKTTRNITMVISLNDDFEGGVYHFPLQNVSIKAKKGRCLIFPPFWTHPHSVSSVNKNRYIVSSWGLTDNIVINEDNSHLNNIIILN